MRSVSSLTHPLFPGDLTVRITRSLRLLVRQEVDREFPVNVREQRLACKMGNPHGSAFKLYFSNIYIERELCGAAVAQEEERVGW